LLTNTTLTFFFGNTTLSGRRTNAPFHAPMKRLDETRAARTPVLRWTAPEGSNIAAE
jgi:hypothetical protein